MLRSITTLSALTLAALLHIAPSAKAGAGVTYQLDSGTASAGIQATGTYTLANQFTAVAGGEFIQSVSLAFHTNTTPNSAIEIVIYSDPNNDGNLADGVILYSEAYQTPASIVFGQFVEYDFTTATTLTPGQSFFVGAFNADSGSFLSLACDANGLGTSSWAILPGKNPAGATVNTVKNFGFTYDLFIRANATSAAIPEPASASALAGLGVLAAVVARRRRR